MEVFVDIVNVWYVERYFYYYFIYYFYSNEKMTHQCRKAIESVRFC